jgi:two-component system sensor histidine kinase YcbA
MGNRFVLLLLIMVATSFFGELKMNPFGEEFRFSLGTACYFFGLIWFRTLRPLETGVLVGLFLLLFRTSLTVYQQDVAWSDAIWTHVPSTVYYLVFATVLAMTDLRKRLERPWLVGLIGTLGDFTGNVGELLTRNALGAYYPLDSHTLLILLAFGTLRSFFVVGLYNMLMIRQVRLLGEQQKSQIERLTLINSSLYEEGFYLQKSMRHIEEITRNSYDLYKQLKAEERRGAIPAELSRAALSIAEEIHELKKDSQRILAGLDKLMRQEMRGNRLSLRSLVDLVLNANRDYARMLGKEILFTDYIDVNLTTDRVYPLVSILNNLVANAVEAIHERGTIGVEVHLVQGQIEWHVWDDGPGISQEDREYIFQPGYTTKYDQEGNSSTGIGLTHCLDLAALLQGEITLLPSERTHFVMRMPLTELLQKEGT